MLQSEDTTLPSLERITLWKSVWSLEDLKLYLERRHLDLNQTIPTGEPPITVSIQSATDYHIGIIEFLEVANNDDRRRETEDGSVICRGQEMDGKAEEMIIRFTKEPISTIET
ncbi:hypothetical protein M422DRAFT_256412 [Sphaerobolus stellatus SS14]|uniref:Uncharacterized protein n=1 Tax=Sphaerobolus stellatus (strain SS14) TaxID=990650 RepID=A0A0C9VQY7_SPHS4|nr:hypothetical protein M422DRAFT_256412 [Sphaerobolus stellatus SS14]